MRNLKSKRLAFTALELVVVLAILLFAIALLLPLVQRVREAAARTQSTNNLKQLGIAMHNFHDSFRGFPPAVDDKGPAHFHILPFIDQDPLFRQADGAAWKNGVYGHVIAVYLDPRDETLPGNVYKDWLGATNYAVNWMIAREGKAKITDITDGTSNTAMFTERYQLCNGAPTAWGYPAIYTWAPMFAYYSHGKFQSAPSQEHCDPRLPQSLRSDILVSRCDASVTTVSGSISPTMWYYFCDPADGNVIEID
jgi:hypothetical protein